MANGTTDGLSVKGSSMARWIVQLLTTALVTGVLWYAGRIDQKIEKLADQSVAANMLNVQAHEALWKAIGEKVSLAELPSVIQPAPETLRRLESLERRVSDLERLRRGT